MCSTGAGLADAAGHGYSTSRGVRSRITFALTRHGRGTGSDFARRDMRSGRDQHGRWTPRRRIGWQPGGGVGDFCNPSTRRKPAARSADEEDVVHGRVKSSCGKETRGIRSNPQARARAPLLLGNGSGLSEQVAWSDPGDFFGEMSLLTGEPRTATASLWMTWIVTAWLRQTCRRCLPTAHSWWTQFPWCCPSARRFRPAFATALETNPRRNKRPWQSRGDLLSRIRRYFEAP